MTLIGLISFVILVVAFLFQLKSNNSYKIYKAFFWVSVAVIILYYFYLVYAQYLIWKDGSELTKFLVPPYESIFYVFGYHFTRFLLYYLIAFAVAVIFFFSAKRLNQRFGGRFFEPAEPYLGVLSVFLLGNPAWNYAWAYYLAVILLTAVIVTGYRLLVTRENRRFSLYWLWLPVAILVMLSRIII